MKRLLATFLWFYAFWYLGSMLAALLGVPDLLGPVFGISAGVIVGFDPFRLFWKQPAPARATAEPIAA